MINQIRSQQAYQQALAINQLRANQQIATYQSRDNITGDRLLQSADGGTIPGKPTVVALVYYSCPVICNQLVNTLVDCARGIDTMTLGKDYQMLFLSYDPRDGQVAAAGKRAQAIQGYGREGTPEIAQGVRFHVGSEETGRQVANAFGFEYRQQPSGEFAHPIVFFMVPIPSTRILSTAGSCAKWERK